MILWHVFPFSKVTEMGVLIGNIVNAPCKSKEHFDSDFSQLSHELRTTLNSINGFAELLLLQGGLSVVHTEYVRAILSGSAALKEAAVDYLDHAPRQRRIVAAAHDYLAANGTQAMEAEKLSDDGARSR